MAITVLTNLDLRATPTDPEHVPNIQWITEFFTGKIKAPVRLVAAIPLAGTFTAPTFELGATGHLSIDGVQVAQGDRVLLVRQTAGLQNGIYVVEDVGNGGPAELRRADDFDESDKIYSGVAISVREGTLHSHTTWRLVAQDPIVLDTTDLEFIPVAPLAAASKFATNIVGNGTDDDFPIAHGLGSTDVSVNIRDLSTNGIVLTSVTVDDSDNITVSFDEPPLASAGPYRVIVMG